MVFSRAFCLDSRVEAVQRSLPEENPSAKVMRFCDTLRPGVFFVVFFMAGPL